VNDEKENRTPIVEPPEEASVEAPVESNQPPDGEESVDSAMIEDAAEQLELITSERDQLAAEVEELKSRLMRRQADFENHRRRVEREREEFLAYAGMESIRAILPVIDDLERALEAAPEEGPVTDYAAGFRMIYQKLFDTLTKLGLEPVESVGQPFDPNVHHAIESVPTENAPDHTVLEELQKGYNFKGKLLREAMVKVAVAPSRDGD